jgi:hypothetical protein
MKTWVSAICAVCAFAASARTVALWPVEYDVARNSWNPFGQVNAVDGSYPLHLYGVNTTISTDDLQVGWELPPNPDPSVPLERARNRRAVAGLSSEGNKPVLSCENLGADYLTRMHDYTVEMYVKLLDLPTGTGWYYLFGALNKDSTSSSDPLDSNNRWMVTFRHDNSAGNYYWNHYSAGGNGGDKKVKTLTNEEAAALTNVWHHIAFTHEARNASDKEEWKLYLDGELLGADSNTPLASIVTPVAHSFEVGGRFSTARASAAFDYIRVSDEVLDPSQFLCAENPNMPNVSSTIAYWKFDVGADGKPDLRPAVGQAELSGLVGIGDKTNMPTTIMTPCRIEQAPTGIAGNNGCVRGRGPRYSFLSHPSVGNEVTLTNDFTVEGWFKPEAAAYDAEANRSLFGTRDKSNVGWTLFLTKNAKFGTGKTWGFFVSVNSDAKTEDVYITNATDMVEWNDWKHVALVYEAGTGNGTWKVYLDGELHGSAPNTVKPSYADPPNWPFLIGGRHNYVTDWKGCIDYVRVSKAALQPSQFLRTNGGAAATDVVATWPLDVSGEMFFEGADISGNENHLDRHWQDMSPNTSSKWMLQAKDDAPTITNPDRTFGFRGDPAAKNGSVQFWEAVNKDTWPGRCSYAATRDRTVIEAMKKRGPLTVEMYVKRTCDASACDTKQWEHLCAWCGYFDRGKRYGDLVLIRYDPTNGFQVNDQAWMQNSGDTSFNNKGAVEPKNEWRHYAFVRTFEGTDLVWRFYINGQQEGIVQKTARISIKGSNPGYSNFLIGGRGFDVTAFKGRIGTVRISSAALAPEDFLCATEQTTPVASAPEVIGIWPLDRDGETVVSTNAVDGRYGLVVSNASVCAERKHGSVALTQGGAVAPYLGLYATMFRPFTVQGWVKNPSGPLCGTWDDTTEGGWRLTANGDGTFNLVGRSNFRSTYYLKETFNAGAINWSAWHHVALVYDPLSGEEGVWTFFVDAKSIGTVANRSRPDDSLLMVPRDLAIAGGYDGRNDGWRTPCRLLAAPFTGVIDDWKFTRKALTAQELDWVPPSGCVLIVR